ncbi:VWA domain-containing protein [Derxia lacustris]|uniref:VWA domain-containing protein n=1 Tax=Derxia lacustris TaxID=764842 RepID=UPI000A1748D5|nr:VWA domain-containing protein [Derxia lacustris]
MAGALARAARRGPVRVLAAACVLLALALLDPQPPMPVAVGSYFFVFDITQSMNVEDARAPGGGTASRLAQARAAAQELLARLPCGTEVGLGVFTERRSLALLTPVEICVHRTALDQSIATLDARMAWAADSHLYYGLYSALDLLRDHLPGSALVLFTDGDQSPPLHPDRIPAPGAPPGSTPGLLLGAGSVLPAPVPRLGEGGRIAGYWGVNDAAGYASAGGPVLSVADMEALAAGTDLRNAPQRVAGAVPAHLSARRDEVLADLARRTGIAWQPLGDGGANLAALQALPGARRVQRPRSFRGALALAAAACLALALLPEGSWRRLSLLMQRKRT